MTQDAIEGLDEFHLLERWAKLLAITGATLVAETGSGCLGLGDLLVGKKKSLLDELQGRLDKGTQVFRAQAAELAYALLRRSKAHEDKKGDEWREGREAAKAIIDSATPLEAIERLRALFGLAQLATTKPMTKLPKHPPWEQE